MINYNKNELINTTLDKYYETFSHTLDTSDYVPEKYNNKILKYIFKNMKKTFRVIDKEDRIYQHNVKKCEKEKKNLQIKKIKKNKPKKNILLICKQFVKKLFKKKVINNTDTNSNLEG